MSEILYQPGDRLLVAADSIGSKALRWWLNSKYSHCVPVLNKHGLTLEIRYPRPHYGHANDYLDGKHRVLHLRPAVAWTPAQIEAYCAEVERIRRHKYDLLSFAGFLLNRPHIENPRRPNCAEGLLLMDHAADLLLGRGASLVSPQSYFEFAAAGAFVVVGEYS